MLSLNYSSAENNDRSYSAVNSSVSKSSGGSSLKKKNRVQNIWHGQEESSKKGATPTSGAYGSQSSSQQTVKQQVISLRPTVVSVGGTTDHAVVREDMPTYLNGVKGIENLYQSLGFNIFYLGRNRKERVTGYDMPLNG